MPGTDTQLTAQDLVEHLVRTRLAGQVATERENNRDNYRRLAAGDGYTRFGLELGARWTQESEVLAAMAEMCGVSPDPGHLEGSDTIDPELTVAALDRAADLLRDAAAGERRVLIATGHPGALIELYRTVAAALRAAGARITVFDGVPDTADGSVVQLCDVGVLSRGATLWHTHSPEPMAGLLAALEAVGEPAPDLVLADHGWAGLAAERGIATIGLADSNDPALFLGEAEGRPLVTVPLDDNVGNPGPYRPLADYLLHRARLTAP